MDSASGTLRITHVITGISPHGAELALLRLVGATAASCRHELIVISGLDALREQFEAAGASVTVIGLGKRSPNPVKLFRLARAIRTNRPDVVQTWLPAADLLGGVLTRLCTRVPVIWNLRISEIEPGRWGYLTYLTTRLNGVLSKLIPTRIVAVGERTAEEHAHIRFDRNRIVVIRNGFTIPERALDRQEARAVLGIPPNAVVVSRLARYHEDKDFPTLLRAWSNVSSSSPDGLLIMAGHGLSSTNDELMGAIREHDIENSVVLLGPLDDTLPLYLASDVVVSSSLAEGMPNVIGEAMASGVPVVVTDVGDSALLVGSAGSVVTAGRADDLARAISEIMHMSPDARAELGSQARQRIVDFFSMETMASQYTSLWHEVAERRNR
jgi:glycosyltransferase involved in cell wall biosynthesis